MKIIAFGDIHMATDVITSIPDIGEADLILLNGDLTNYGSKGDAKKILDAVMRKNPNVLAQFGNLDQPEVNDYLEKLGINLHGQARLIQGKVCLVGVGGSNYTPFNTPSEFSEKELLLIASQAFEQGQELSSLAEPLHSKKIPVILISHAPPYNTTLDVIHSGKHVGSTAIRSAIERYQPDLCVSGHIHEAKGSDSIGQTPIYNPGMLRRGGFLSVEIEQSQLKLSLQ